MPVGWTEVRYDERRWGLTRTERAGGGLSIFAEELGGPGRVSANVYVTRRGPVLKPCEMPAAHVLGFLRAWTALPAPRPRSRARLTT